MLLNMLENGLHSNTYVLRGRVLADVFPITESELGGHVIQCGVEVGWLANKLFKGLPSFSEQSTCENCSFTKINKLTSISVQEESLRTFEPATFIINSCLNATLSHCPQCQSEESVRHELVEIGKYYKTPNDFKENRVSTDKQKHLFLEPKSSQEEMV